MTKTLTVLAAAVGVAPPWMMSTHAAPVWMMTVPEVCKRMGNKSARLYVDVREGLMTPPIKRGRRFSRWPSNEVEALVQARIAGADDAAVRALVVRLVAQRTRGQQ